VCVYNIYIYIYASAGGKEVLWSDTVGFIQKLPTKLVSSFRATLEELEDASLVLN
jgi:GTP-binding protein HflX